MPPTTASTSPQRPVRDRTTLLLYAAMGVVGYACNAWGSILGPLQHSLGVSRSAVAFYPSLFAVALVVVGLVGGRAIERIGHRAGLAVALGGMLAGVLLLCAPSRLPTVAGALVLGLGAALMIQVAPAVLTHGRAATAVATLAEANAVSSLSSLLGPASVAVAIVLGLGWWLGFLLPVVPVAAVLLLVFLIGAPPPAGNPAPVDGVVSPLVAGLEPGPLLGRWCDLVLAIGVEFCLVFWAADTFREWHGSSEAAATSLAATFLIGMALVRCFSARLTAGRPPAVIVLRACATAATGFAVFWLSPPTWLAAGGLMVAGMGVALLYPICLARVVAAWPQARDRAAARGALASGTAIGLAPLLLAQLAGLIGLRAAYLVVPALLLGLATRALWAGRVRPPRPWA